MIHGKSYFTALQQSTETKYGKQKTARMPNGTSNAQARLLSMSHLQRYFWRKSPGKFGTG
jgi:hypothetical protein